MDMDSFITKINQWDHSTIQKYNGFGGKIFTLFLRGLSFLGRETVWICLMLFFFFVWYDPVVFSYIASTFLLGVVIIAPTKRVVNRARPFEELKDIKILEPQPTSRSFPSWHVYNVISQGLLFSFILDSFFLTIGLLVIASLVAFSRIQLGAHYPSDVLAGCVIGIFGFLCVIFLVAPFMYSILTFLEQFVVYEIHYRVLSPFFENIWYILLISLMYGIVLIIAFIKRIKSFIKRLSRNSGKV